MKTIRLKIVTPEGVFKEADASAVYLNTTQGYTEILPRHMSYVTPIKEGKLETVIAGNREYYKVGDGLLYVEKSLITVLVEKILNNNSEKSE